MNYLQNYILSKSSYLPSDKLFILQKELEDLDNEALNVLMMVEMHQPLVALILAIFFGEFGVDRFYVGNKELGFAKLIAFAVSFVTLFILIGFLLFLGLYLWKFIDCFLIMRACTDGCVIGKLRILP
ncbi:TM2 domain-containing protein [Streptococcus suis]|uniref:TM2 domain-containing protein n=1 Tax=Streptococcus suis TaxID=1307 RepID=UPI00207CFB3F|nr:TM2 domain-containing protein [Streptococcus suis]MCO0798332.1 TM2 domain-containing protein [Streptococcus suis]MCO0810118.1 TM2 domain-containing protein [Streptococcus suis]MCO0845020.1 TM2 domain-containing protein [Streptococcus suis]